MAPKKRTAVPTTVKTQGEVEASDNNTWFVVAWFVAAWFVAAEVAVAGVEVVITMVAVVAVVGEM
jgi:hypothetical protein